MAEHRCMLGSVVFCRTLLFYLVLLLVCCVLVLVLQTGAVCFALVLPPDGATRLIRDALNLSSDSPPRAAQIKEEHRSTKHQPPANASRFKANPPLDQLHLQIRCKIPVFSSIILHGYLFWHHHNTVIVIAEMQKWHELYVF